MNSTARTKKALAIGNTAIDEFYREGALETVQPGGTAFNVASWFRHHGFQSYLCSTLGMDFPDLSDIDTSLCEVIDAESPRCQVTLNESNVPEKRSWVQGEYQYRPLGAVNDRFDVVLLTSGKTEFATPFNTTIAAVKGFALDPLVYTYQTEQIAAYLNEANYLFLNKNERRILEKKLKIEMKELPIEYNLHAAIETSAERVLLYEYDGSINLTAIDTLDDPVDTTGAGDAFASTFLYEITRGSNTDNAMQSAHEAAEWTITNLGAHPFRSD